MTQAVFALASGRSGTHFLYQVIRRNATNAVCRHEPYGWNPSMFGRPIYDRAMGNLDPIRRLLARKAQIVERCGRELYVETSHAFLKSYKNLAAEFFPHLKLVHLVREPLQVAKSEANREQFTHNFHLPLRHYRGGDGRKYFRWALTGHEPIYGSIDVSRLSLFQKYVVQWIAIENRAMQFLERFDKHRDCFTLHGPADLNSPGRMAELFDFLGLARRQRDILIAGRKNRTPGRKTVIGDEDRRQFAEVVALLPREYLQIFAQPPYSEWDWSRQLRPSL